MRIVRILFSLKETIKIEAIDLMKILMMMRLMKILMKILLMMRPMMKVGKDLKTIDDKSVVAVVVLAEMKIVSEMKTWKEAREIQTKMLRRLERWKVSHQ
jgi:hypothetical protein